MWSNDRFSIITTTMCFSLRSCASSPGSTGVTSASLSIGPADPHPPAGSGQPPGRAPAGPPDTISAVQRHERHGFILERIASNGHVSVRELADELQVSTASVRRDLEFLEGQKSLARTHGGAVAGGVIYELPLRYRAGRHEEEKRRIAARAAVRVANDGAVVGLTGGTTTTEVARCLVDRTQLTVVTNALNIATELVVRPTVKLVVTAVSCASAPMSCAGRSPRRRSRG